MSKEPTDTKVLRYSQIRNSDKNHKKTDYEKVVEPFYRNEAAKTLQHAAKRWRESRNILKKLYQTERYNIEKMQLARSYWSTTHQKIKGNKLTEPADDGFNQEIAQFVKNNQYELIHYHHPDFTRHLFSTLRAGLITMNEMTTIKFMYESLICFNQGKLPEKTSTQFSCFRLDDVNGPYQPDKNISYWQQAETEKLNDVLKDPEQAEKLRYYTINLSRYQLVGFLYSKLKNKNLNHQIESLLYQYGQTAPFSPEERELFKKNIDNMYLSPVNIESMINLMSKNEPFLIGYEEKNLFIYNSIQLDAEHKEKVKKIAQDLKLSLEEYQREVNNLKFMAALDITQIPMLCISPQYSPTNPNSPLLSFVLPTIDTLNVLQSIVHGEEATIPIAVLGEETTRMIRAYDEVPASKMPTKSQRLKTPQLLMDLYPTANSLDAPSRPIELTHPDIVGTPNPHGYNCSDFFLSWHDIYHAWVNGTNDKLLFRKIRQLHDEKAGFALKQDMMSKVIWGLTDMDFPSAYRLRKSDPNTIYFLRVNFLMFVLSKGIYHFDKAEDDNYLFIYGLYQDPEMWKLLQWYIGQASLKSTDTRLSLFPEINKKLNQLLEAIEQMQRLLEKKPEASVVEIILYDLLKPTEPNDLILVEALKKIGLKEIFYWSRVSHFHKNELKYAA